MSINNYIEDFNKSFKEKYPNKGFFIVTCLIIADKKFPIYKSGTVKVMHFPSKETVYVYSFKDRVSTTSKLPLKYVTIILKELKDIKLKMEEYGNNG